VTPSAALAVVASFVYLARLVPQPWRVLKTRDSAGVSALAAMNSLVADVAWLAYGIHSHLTVVWAVSIPAVVVSMATLVLLRRSLTWSDLTMAAAWSGVIIAMAVAHLLAGALAVTVLVTCGPSLRSAFAHPEPTGLARSTWLIALADAATWGAYGVALGDPALEMYGSVLMATAIAILLRLRSKGRVAVA
jgi:uncharacterized protein with PQ loop repeat